MTEELEQIDVAGMMDPKHNIVYIGKATKMEDGTWRCLANVEGSLCLVEVNIRLPKEDPRASVFCCSFCGKSSDECEVLIAGPMVNICNECVVFAQAMVDDIRSGTVQQKTPVNFVKHIPTKMKCETCLKISAQIKSGPILKPFVPPLGEFSGCRCAHCPEREGIGECSCCTERREEEKNPGPEPFV
jgi:hypothetical protein